MSDEKELARSSMERLSLLADAGQKNTKKINRLLQDIDRNGYNCTGKPEPLSGNLSGFWSIRIDAKNRIVFRIENATIEIAQCGTYYGDN